MNTVKEELVQRLAARRHQKEASRKEGIRDILMRVSGKAPVEKEAAGFDHMEEAEKIRREMQADLDAGRTVRERSELQSQLDDVTSLAQPFRNRAEMEAQHGFIRPGKAPRFDRIRNLIARANAGIDAKTDALAEGMLSAGKGAVRNLGISARAVGGALSGAGKAIVGAGKSVRDTTADAGNTVVDKSRKFGRRAVAPYTEAQAKVRSFAATPSQRQIDKYEPENQVRTSRQAAAYRTKRDLENRIKQLGQ